MANNDKKSQVTARVLVDQLTTRLAALASPLFVAQNVDSSGNPVIGISGTSAAEAALVASSTGGTAGHQDMVLKIIPQAAIGVDGLGNAAVSYGPHTIQCALELSASSNVPLFLDLNLWPVLWCLFGQGMKVELYEVANGTGVGTGGITGSPVLTVDSLQFPFIGTV